MDPHHFGYLDPHPHEKNPDPHQCDKLDPEPDPHINLQMTSQNAGMEYEPI
jgi:hypothetical protein